MSLNLSLSGHLVVKIDGIIVYDSHNTVTSAAIEYVRDCLTDVDTTNPVHTIRLTHDSGTSSKSATVSPVGISGFVATGNWTYADGDIDNIVRFSLRNNTDEIAYAIPATFNKSSAQNLAVVWTITVT